MDTVAEQVVRLSDGAGVPVSQAVTSSLARFIGLLAKWNRRLNLTGLDLDPPSDEAVMRLLVEPMAAGSLIPSGVRVAIDVGSGGGSPALPLKLLRPDIRFLLVEAKVRKCAFLREAVRELRLEGVDVVTGRFDDVAGRDELRAAADLVTVRAVRLDDEFWKPATGVLRPGGHVVLFGTTTTPATAPAAFTLADSLQVPGTNTTISLARRV